MMAICKFLRGDLKNNSSGSEEQEFYHATPHHDVGKQYRPRHEVAIHTSTSLSGGQLRGHCWVIESQCSSVEGAVCVEDC